MATYEVGRVKHATLTANTVDVVSLTAKWAEVEVLNRSTSDVIFFRIGDEDFDPTVDGDDCYVVPPGEGLVVPVSDRRWSGEPTDESTEPTVRLISAGTPDYTVTGV